MRVQSSASKPLMSTGVLGLSLNSTFGRLSPVAGLKGMNGMG